MSNRVARSCTAFFLCLACLFSLIAPLHAAADGPGESAYLPYDPYQEGNDPYPEDGPKKQEQDSLPSLLYPQDNTYLTPGVHTILWEPVEGALRYSLTIDNLATAKEPDTTYTFSTLTYQKQYNLPLAVAIKLTVRVQVYDDTGAKVWIDAASSTISTAVVYNGKVLKAVPQTSTATVNLAVSSGTLLPLRYTWADASASSLQFTAAGDLPPVEEVLLTPTGSAPLPFTAKPEGADVRILATEDADKGKSYTADLSVRLAGMEQAIPVGKVTLKTTMTLPKLSFTAANLDLFSNRRPDELQFKLSDSSLTDLRIDPDTDSANPHPDYFLYDFETNALKLNPDRLQSIKAGTYKVRMLASVEGCTQTLSSVLTVRVTETKPPVKLANASVTLFPRKTEDTAPFWVQLASSSSKYDFDELDVTDVQLVDPADMTDAERRTYPYNDQFSCSYAGGGRVQLELLSQTNLPAGKLLLAVSFGNTDRTLRLPLTVKVTNSTAAPTVTLSKTSVTVNKTPYPDQEAQTLTFSVSPANVDIGTLRVAEVISGKEQPVSNFTVTQDGNTLTVMTNADTPIGSRQLRFTPDFSGGRAVTLTVRVADKMPALTLSVKTRPDISKPEQPAVLLCKLTNTAYTLDDALEVSIDNEKFIVEAIGPDGLLSLRALGGLRKGVSEVVTVTLRLPDGIVVTRKVTLTPLQSTVYFALAREYLTLVAGETSTLAVQVNSKKAPITWSSDNETVAAVDANGKVTAKAVGSAVITAKAGAYSDTVVVSVVTQRVAEDGSYNLVNNGRQLTDSLTLSGQGQRFQLTHLGGGAWRIARLSDGKVLTAEGDTLRFTYPQGSGTQAFTLEAAEALEAAEDGGVRILSADGLALTATQDGKAVLAEKDDSAAQVWKLEAKQVVTGIQLAQTSLVLSPGDMDRLSAATTPAGMESALVFSSSNPSVCTVDASGKLTAKQAGSAVITVSDVDKTVTAFCQVTVQAPKASLKDGVYRISLGATSEYLTVSGGGDKDGTAVITTTKTDGLSQLFRLRNVGDTIYLYPLSSNDGNSKVLDVYRGNSTTAPIQEGCKIDIWACNDAEAQAWVLRETGSSGLYQITLSAHPQLAIAVGNVNGQAQLKASDSRSAFQQWAFTEVQDPTTGASTPQADSWRMPLASMNTTNGFGASFSNNPAYWGHLAWDGVCSDLRISAAADGVVKLVRSTANSSGHGNFVLIQHVKNGKVFYSAYSHMKDNSILVKVGQTVRAGQQIGTMGATGNVTGRHLHFCVYKGTVGLPYSYCKASFSASYRQYLSYKYYDPLQVVRTDGALVTSNY